MELDIIKLIGELGVSGICIVLVWFMRIDQKRHEVEIKGAHENYETRLISLIIEGNELRREENASRLKYTETLTKLSVVIEELAHRPIPGGI